MEMARRNIAVFFPAGGQGVDVVATCVAGCGAMLREYDVLLRDDPEYADRARRFVTCVRDISEVIVELGLPPMAHPLNVTVAYHDACHLAHAQKVTIAPRQLLSQIPGLKLIALSESDVCCGAAGTYNLMQPEMAAQLAARKLANLAATGATMCAAGNVGCAMHLQAAANDAGDGIRFVHPIELLHAAVFGR
jgi:glycolate oxidase iron-sulfur subunit